MRGQKNKNVKELGKTGKRRKEGQDKNDDDMRREKGRMRVKE